MLQNRPQTTSLVSVVGLSISDQRERERGGRTRLRRWSVMLPNHFRVASISSIAAAAAVSFPRGYLSMDGWILDGSGARITSHVVFFSVGSPSSL